jgi:CHAT domain-containing protein/tetratricopeptide (TPR) repeat protein
MTRAILSIVLVSVVTLCAIVLQLDSNVAFAIGHQNPVRRISLETGETIRGNLKNGRKNYYQIDVLPGHFFRLVVTSVDYPLKIAIRDPNGHLCREGRSRRFGPISLSSIASVAGGYLIEVGSFEGVTHEGSYDIRLEENRPLGEEDKIRIASELVFSEAQSLSERNNAESRRQANEKYDQALAGWRELGDRREEAMTLNSKGLVLVNSGEYQQALDCLTQAQLIWQSINDQEGLAESLYHIANIHADWGNLRLARESAILALDLLQPLNRLRGLARAKTALAVIRIQSGEPQQALDLYREALEINRRIHNAVGEMMALNGLGRAYYEIGDDWNAIDNASRALQAAEQNGNLTFQNVAHTTIGLAYTRLGDTQRALTHATQGLDISLRTGDQRLEAYSLKQLGAIYEALGERSRALDHYERALMLNRETQNRQEVAVMLNSIGVIHESHGDRQKALACYREALPISREAENHAEEVRSLHNIARVLRDLGSLDKSRDPIEQAIKLIESLRARVGGRQLRESYFSTAQKSYELYIDVLMLLHKQRPTEGLDEIALQISEQARARSLREMLAESHIDLRKNVPPDLLERERSLQQDLNSKAARQQNLLSGAHSSEEAEKLARELRSLAREYDEVRRQIRESAPRYAALTQPQPLTSKEIQQLLLDNDTALLEYALGDDRSYLWLVTPNKIISYELPPRSVIEKTARQAYKQLVMRESLNTDKPEKYEERVMHIKRAEEQYWIEAKSLSRMILFPIASELKQSRLVIVSDGALQYLPFGALPVPERQGDGEGSLPATGRRTEGEIVRSNKSSPHRPVPVPSTGRESSPSPGLPVFPTPLIVKHEIVNLPSASTLAELRKETADRRPAPKTIAVIANPVFAPDDNRFALTRNQADNTSWSSALTDQLLRAWKSGSGEIEIPALPFSEREGSEIIKLAPPESSLLATGFNANRSLLENQYLSQYRFIHFATHGLMNGEYPELSGLILSLYKPDGKKIDGFLRMHEIYNLNLPSDMVVLSACQTGIGKEIKGEGLVGLTRGFMYAGASRVVASLWKVDDAATAALMEHFYRCLFQEKLSPSAALRQAQLRTMKQNRRWRSPYYWAAFVLQGEYR